MNKDDKIQKKSFPYEFPVELETRAHGNIVARCPQLPGCQAQGKTPKEALENLKNAIELYFTSATPAFFEGLENFEDIPTFYDLAEFRGYLFAATGRDLTLRSSSGAPGSWQSIPVSRMQSKFYTTAPGKKGRKKKEPEAEGDYAVQVYCLATFAAPGKETALFAGTNANGAIYLTQDGENWKEAFTSGEDRIHALCEFKSRLYAGSSSQGKVFAYDGVQWNTVGSLSEVGITCLGVFKNRLYAGTYPSGLIFSTPDGLNWEETVATGQNFIQCFKEFNGAFYAGTSSPKGIKIYRTDNGQDWLTVYESSRELNLYCLEVFENTLFAGTGNSGRVLKTQDGAEWKTAYAGDQEGVRAFALFGDYLYAGTENNGAILRSTFDMARMPVISDVSVEKLSSCSALVTWATDISATSELHYGEKRLSPDLRRVIQDRGLELMHRIHLTDLKAETEYGFKVVSAYRSSSQSVSETSAFTTRPVLPPDLSSPSHPQPGKWEKQDDIEALLHPEAPMSGYYYLLNHYPETIPAPPEAAFTDEKRVALPATPQGQWYLHVAGVDEAGNIGHRASHYKILIDTEALPPSKIASDTHPKPEKWEANPTPVVTWEKPADLSGVKGYFVKADHEPNTVPGPGAGEFTAENRVSLGPLEDGLWFVHVATQDEAGNLGAQAVHYPVRIDTKALAPGLSSPSHPQEDQWYSNNKVEVIISAPHDLSGIEGYYHLIDQEPNTLPAPQNSVMTENNKVVYPDLADGTWYVHVRTLDKAGNLSPQAAHMKVCVDTLASPALVSSTTHSEGGTWYKNRRVVLSWEDPFENSGIEGYFYNIDKKSDTIPGSGSSLFTGQRSLSFEVTDDGLWYFHIATKDKAGNLDWKAAHYPIRVDTEAGRPFLSSATHPDENQWYSKTRAVFKIAPPDDLSGITHYYYTFSEDPTVEPDAKSSSTDKTELILDIPRDGLHYLSVICQDAAGNLSAAPAVYKVRLDTAVEAPAVASPSHPNPDLWYGARRVETTWKDPTDLSGIDGYYYAFNREENWKMEVPVMTWTTARGAVFTLAEDGSWFVHVCAKDKAGNIGPLAHFRLQADSQSAAPIVKSPTHGENQWVKATVPQFTWEAPKELSGVEGYYTVIDAQSHTIPGPGGGQWTTENQFTGPALKDGRWYFHAATKDRVGNVSREAGHYCFMIDNTPPKSQMKPLAPIMDKTQLFIEWSATDAGSGVASCDVQVKLGEKGDWGDWLTNVSERSAVFNAKDGGRYAFRSRARDHAGNEENYPDAEMTSTIVDISPPLPVTHLKATPQAGGDIELKWSPVEDKISGTDYYRLYRWVEGEKRQKISVDGQVKGMEFTDPGALLKENTVYYYSVQAVDRMGNEQHEGNAGAASLSDRSVGVPQVTSPTHSSDDWSANTSSILAWTAPADATGIAGYYYLLDQSPSTKVIVEGKGGAEDASTPVPTFIEDKRLELSDLQSGIWYFHLVAKDRAGNISDQTAHYRLKIDPTRPEAPHIVPKTHPDPQRWYSASKLEFNITAAPKLSGVEAFYYSFDHKEDTVPLPDIAQRTTEGDVTVKASEVGAWYFHAAVKDKAGNFSEPTHVRVLIAAAEMPPPVVLSPSHPREDEPANHHEPHFTWEDRHDGSFAPAGYVYKLSQNEDDKLTPEDQFTIERSVQFKDVEEGTWFFHVAAVGKKGKPGLLSARRRVIIRRLGKVSGSFLRKDGLTPVSGTKVEVYKGDKVAATAVTDPKGGFHFSGLPEGRYELRLHSDQFPVLRLKDILVTVEEGLSNAVFTEDLGVFPTPPAPGPIRFYYFLKEDCNVTLEVFDSTGTLVEKITEKKEGGAYNTTLWDAAGKGAGEYLYKLSAKSITKNAMSRFSVKKFRIEKAAPVLEAQSIS